mmetsp:Transcript_11213/g.30566  ORF Transcript_11213/g.30566 Transcript_11213/m.30566 type:complete len:234 (-) Transcript_11213:166-867(-)
MKLAEEAFKFFTLAFIAELPLQRRHELSDVRTLHVRILVPLLNQHPSHEALVLLTSSLEHVPERLLPQLLLYHFLSGMVPVVFKLLDSRDKVLSRFHGPFCREYCGPLGVANGVQNPDGLLLVVLYQGLDEDNVCALLPYPKLIVQLRLCPPSPPPRFHPVLPMHRVKVTGLQNILVHLFECPKGALHFNYSLYLVVEKVQEVRVNRFLFFLFLFITVGSFLWNPNIVRAHYS